MAELPAWDTLQAADLSPDVKTQLNRVRVTLDDLVTDLARRVCNVADGLPLEPGTIELCEDVIAEVRRIPTWI